ncbi:FUSC family protein [Myroides ceti]|uniref:FUSC family protein n=1 Tax=Paenimyroides ceti TaxID=395087 RepID=A0ABT8CRZ9_9FLAO|nr:FUSC family protein [Paenimyroides ceti]MDN3705997.1 FUSC family protein [Paenimyroides ceti]
MWYKNATKLIESQFIVYVTRCLLGFVIGYLLTLAFPKFDLFWTLLTIILVISPEEDQARKLSIERFKSNFIGSISGLLVFFLPFEDVYKVIIGIVLACFICKLFNLLNVARSAIVALIIILIEHKNDVIFSPVARFLAVAVGCIIGLGVTLTTSSLLKFLSNVIRIKKIRDE